MAQKRCSLCTNAAWGTGDLCEGCTRRQAAIRREIDDLNEKLARQPAVAEENDREWYGHFTYSTPPPPGYYAEMYQGHLTGRFLPINERIDDLLVRMEREQQL